MIAPTQQLDTPIGSDMNAPETESAQAKLEIDASKTPVTASLYICGRNALIQAPLRITEMAVEIAIERSRATEALKARDATVQRLVEAHESVQQKSASIELLQRSLKSRVNPPLTSDSPTPIDRLEATKTKEEIVRLKRTIVELRVEIRTLRENAANSVEMSQALSEFGSESKSLSDLSSE
ncbi:hypothetical protein C0992_006654 [Termitomyces sp. T32_za158]|nr:hypothetical protein C0992_006654 [Termitomyces sp. T32_za158]